MSESLRRNHIALKPNTIVKRRKGRWTKGGEKVEQISISLDHLRSQLAITFKSILDRERYGNIFIDRRIYFKIILIGSIYWYGVQDELKKLPIKIKEIVSDNTIIVSLHKENYDDFYQQLVNCSDIIGSISEVDFLKKINYDVYDYVNNNQQKMDEFTLEFSDLNGIEDFERLNEALTHWVTEQHGEIQLNYYSNTLLLYTLRILNRNIKTLIESVDSISFIDQKHEVELSMVSDQVQLDFLKDHLISPEELVDLPVICIIDSGINRTHPKIKKLLEGTYDFLTEDPNPCEDNVGHGTWVSGFAIYGYNPSSQDKPTAKVMMIKNFIDEKSICQNEISAIQKVLHIFPNQFRIMNLSFSYRGPNPSLTKVLDRIVFENNLILVTSAGNIKKDEIEQDLKSGLKYPDYLQKHHIYYPGDCRNIMTVGSCTQKGSNIVPANAPSPFTRSSPSRSMIKPDLLEIGGNLQVTEEKTLNLQGDGLGLFTISHSGEGYVEKHGTSFSSPIVANMLARLRSQLNIDSSALLKALVISSCSMMKDFEVNIQGFGKPDIELALYSNPWRVCYLLEGQFSSRYPELSDRYEIWFPFGADQMEVTLVREKSETVYANEEKETIEVEIPHRGGTGGKTKLQSSTGESKWSGVYKGKYAVGKGSRGVWYIDLVPNFLARNLYLLKMRYGCVVTIKDTKGQNDIWDKTYNDWLRTKIEPPILKEEINEPTMEPLKPIEIRRTTSKDAP